MSNAPMNANMGHTGVPTSQPRHGSGVSIKRRLESFATSGVTVRSQGHVRMSCEGLMGENRERASPGLCVLLADRMLW
jgi:hypothetical protein